MLFFIENIEKFGQYTISFKEMEVKPYTFFYKKREREKLAIVKTFIFYLNYFWYNKYFTNNLH